MDEYELSKNKKYRRVLKNRGQSRQDRQKWKMYRNYDDNKTRSACNWWKKQQRKHRTKQKRTEIRKYSLNVPRIFFQK